MEVEIGIGKSGRRAYGFDDIAIVPSRRTRDPEDVDISWELDAFKFELPVIGSAMDGVVSPTHRDRGRSASAGSACLNLEGSVDALRGPRRRCSRRSPSSPTEKATRRMQEIYAEPIKEELIGRRIREIKDAGVTACASLTPQRVEQYAKHVLDAELDILVDPGHGRVGRARVEDPAEPLNLKKFIREFEHPGHRRRVRVVLHRAAPHAHRRGRRARGCRPRPRVHQPRRARHRRAAGHRDRRRRGRAHPSPRRDRRVRARHRRRRHAHRRRHRQGDRVRRRRGDDRFAARRRRTRRPGRGYHWGMATFHPTLPRGARVQARARRRRSPRSSSGPRTRTTARSTSSARCARRWPPPATRR